MLYLKEEEVAETQRAHHADGFRKGVAVGVSVMIAVCGIAFLAGYILR